MSVTITYDNESSFIATINNIKVGSLDIYIDDNE
jgi:hypothetical protein